MNMATATTPERYLCKQYIQASDANRKNFSDPRLTGSFFSVASTDVGKKGWTDISDMAAQYFAFDDKMRALVADGPPTPKPIRQITGAGRDMESMPWKRQWMPVIDAGTGCR